MAWAHGRRPTGDGGEGSGAGEDIYWLNGMAGMGMSTIARTIARTEAEEGHLGASFFLSRGGGELERARLLVTTVAVQLAQQSPQLRAIICEAIHAHPNIANQILVGRWKQLMLRPSEWLPPRLEASAVDCNDEIQQSTPPRVVVIDALNICTDDEEKVFVLQLLAEMWTREELSQLRVFIMSRPVIIIREGFRDGIPESRHPQFFLHRLDFSIANHDIRVFVDRNVGSILRKRPDWAPSSARDVVEMLVYGASGLFIWAATACHFIRDGSPMASKRLELVLEHKALPAGVGPERTLDEIYKQVLAITLSNSDSPAKQDELCSALRTVLGTLVVLFSALLAARRWWRLLRVPGECGAPTGCATCTLRLRHARRPGVPIRTRPFSLRTRPFLLRTRPAMYQPVSVQEILLLGVRHKIWKAWRIA
jgi:hypothetical protein